MQPDDPQSAPPIEVEDEVSQTRKRIIQAAIKVFGEQGYAKATTRGIAAAAEVNEVTLFRHFGSKQNLLVEVVKMFTDFSGLQRVIDNLTGDYREDLRVLGMYFITEMAYGREIFRVVTCDVHHFPELKEMIMRGPVQMRELLTDYFRRQIDQGRLRPELQPETVAHLFASFFLLHRSMMHRLQRDSLPTNPSAIVDQFIDILARGTASNGEF
jgi:AcrR family transcriptional regulator